MVTSSPGESPGWVTPDPGEQRPWKRLVSIVAIVLALLAVGLIAIIFLGAQVLESLRGTIEFGTGGGSGCVVGGRATSFDTDTDVHVVAHPSRDVAPGEQVTFRATADGRALDEAQPRTDLAVDRNGCLTSVVEGPLLPAHYRIELIAGPDMIASGEFDVFVRSGSQRASASANAAGPSVTMPPTRPPSESVTTTACDPLPHEDPALEALMPTTIAGRRMTTWSVHGAGMILCLQDGTQADVAALEQSMAAEGYGLDDLSVAITGRSDVDRDPPYFIIAFEFAGASGSDWSPGMGTDHPDVGSWTEATIHDKYVLIGDPAMIEQTEHARGTPYSWHSDDIHYLVVTDDRSWAEEALGLIH